MTIPVVVAATGIVLTPAAVVAPAPLYADMPQNAPQSLLTDEMASSSAPAVSVRPEPILLECECVRYLRERLGVNIRGDAHTIQPNIPLGDITIGTVILFDYGDVQHAALIIGLNRDIATIQEANWRHCKETVREVSIYDKSVRGFFRP